MADQTDHFSYSCEAIEPLLGNLERSLQRINRSRSAVDATLIEELEQVVAEIRETIQVPTH